MVFKNVTSKIRKNIFAGAMVCFISERKYIVNQENPNFIRENP
ncbi:Uncharacterized protein dnm_066480 [Desulfonema magnum]|uniref:Uncharacterized protein n=1 Tax=Desulfonema magnum TaxID=45655 RepID=A0A975BSH1_9BACT|nr:Uncharacterized protein dnm_066480 [Desulfonema magnum]